MNYKTYNTLMYATYDVIIDDVGTACLMMPLYGLKV